MDFTQMPVSQGYKYLLDTFTGWIGGFPTWTEKAEKVVRKLLHEIIPRFGLPRSLQNDNGKSFTSKVTQGVFKALGITYYLHHAWRPQSSGKVERANQFLKSAIKKITKETSLGWKKALQIAPLCTCIAPKEQIGLSPSVQFSSVTQLCSTLCNPMNRSTPGLPVHHHHREFTQTHIH